MASQAPSPETNSRSLVIPYPVLWSVALIAAGLIGGTIAGGLVAARLPAQGAALEQHVYAQQPARNEPLNPLPVSANEGASSTPPVAQPPAAASLPVAPPVVAPAVRAAVGPSAPPAAIARVKLATAPVAATDADTYDLGTARGARSGTELSQPSKEAASRAKSTPTSESTQTANLGKDLFESVR
jgi:hypothetical protein